MSKKKRKTYHHGDIYEWYKEVCNVNRKHMVDKKTHRNICDDFNKMVMDEIIDGKVFAMGALLGDLMIVRHNRNYNSTSAKSIDWNASMLRKEELEEEGIETFDKKERPNGVHWYVYFDSPYYVKFYWTKKKVKVKNYNAYKFSASRGKVGTKTKLKERLASDDLAYLDYREVRPQYGSV